MAGAWSLEPALEVGDELLDSPLGLGMGHLLAEELGRRHGDDVGSRDQGLVHVVDMSDEGNGVAVRIRESDELRSRLDESTKILISLLSPTRMLAPRVAKHNSILRARSASLRRAGRTDAASGIPPASPVPPGLAHTLRELLAADPL